MLAPAPFETINQKRLQEMLRLNLASEPEWLDLEHGVRVRVLPCTSGVMAVARGSDAVEALATGASEAELALALASAMAGVAILDWEGVGDADGKPVPVTPEAAALRPIKPLPDPIQHQGLTPIRGRFSPVDIRKGSRLAVAQQHRRILRHEQAERRDPKASGQIEQPWRFEEIGHRPGESRGEEAAIGGDRPP